MVRAELRLKMDKITHPKALRWRLCHWKWFLDGIPMGRQRRQPPGGEWSWERMWTASWSEMIMKDTLFQVSVRVLAIFSWYWLPSSLWAPSCYIFWTSRFIDWDIFVNKVAHKVARIRLAVLPRLCEDKDHPLCLAIEASHPAVSDGHGLHLRYISFPERPNYCFIEFFIMSLHLVIVS